MAAEVKTRRGCWICRRPKREVEKVQDVFTKKKRVGWFCMDHYLSEVLKAGLKIELLPAKPVRKARSKKVKPKHRHTWGPYIDHGFQDGYYQTCHYCGQLRFKGDRYSYGSRSKR